MDAQGGWPVVVCFVEMKGVLVEMLLGGGHGDAQGLEVDVLVRYCWCWG